MLFLCVHGVYAWVHVQTCVPILTHAEVGGRYKLFPFFLKFNLKKEKTILFQFTYQPQFPLSPLLHSLHLPPPTHPSTPQRG